MVKEKKQSLSRSQQNISKIKELVLYNDDVNTFDFVIETLMITCNHELEQAEQCALITHYRGKCAVKSGAFDKLKPIFDEITNRGLTVAIE